MKFGLAPLPLFTGLVLIQAAMQPAFDLRTMPLSVLSLGPWGWMQTINFLLSGLLIMVCAIGVGSALSGRGGRFAAAMIFVYGLGMAAAGLFPSDAIEGYPAGAHRAEDMSLHAQLHGAAFALSHLALIGAAVSLAVILFRRGSAAGSFACAATAIGVPALIALGFTTTALMGAAFFTTGVLAMSWLALVASVIGRSADR